MVKKDFQFSGISRSFISLENNQIKYFSLLILSKQTYEKWYLCLFNWLVEMKFLRNCHIFFTLPDFSVSFSLLLLNRISSLLSTFHGVMAFSGRLLRESLSKLVVFWRLNGNGCIEKGTFWQSVDFLDWHVFSQKNRITPTKRYSRNVLVVFFTTTKILLKRTQCCYRHYVGNLLKIDKSSAIFELHFF